MTNTNVNQQNQETPSDPHRDLTAYALGEMDVAEASSVEARIDQNPADRAFVEATRTTAAAMQSALADEPDVGLSPAQRDRIERAVASRKTPSRTPGSSTPGDRRAGNAPGAHSSRLPRWIGPIVALAACLAILLSLVPGWRSNSNGETDRSAQKDQRVARVGLATDPETTTSEQADESPRPTKSPGVSPETMGRADSKWTHTAIGLGGGRPGQQPVAGNLNPKKSPTRFRNVRTIQGIYMAGGAAGGPAGAAPHGDKEMSRERYDRIRENPFIRVAADPLSTFSIDVDTASYANLRRFLQSGSQPPADAVRIEELINYFSYDYAGPAPGEAPFATHVETSDCPWNDAHRLVRIGLQGRKLAFEKRPAMNLVFLLDVSGSMGADNKLPLLLRSLRLFVPTLTENDKVAIVVYAGNAGLVLPSTAGDRHPEITDALNRLRAGGSTAGGAGIQLAYRVAAENFVEGGVNRVLLATDGDFNVGVSNTGSLTRLIEEKAKSNIFLSVLGFGMGNLNDSMMEAITNKGNGNYSYIDNLNEAKKVLIEQASGTFVTIAKDVKIQVEFNPSRVAAYRLIGYENRIMAHQDFDDDKKDAGEIGAGHSVTALYEVVPAGVEPPGTAPKPLKYQTPREKTAGATSKELLTLKLRYKEPEGKVSQLLEISVTDTGAGLAKATDDFRFAASVAGFGLLLRGSKNSGDLTYDDVHRLARKALGEDLHGYRAEFLGLVRKAQQLGESK